MIGSFTSAHNDHLDPDRACPNDEPGIGDSIMDAMGGDADTPLKFYKALYRGLTCGPTVVMWIGGDKFINDQLPDEPFEDLIVTGIEVGTIVEGWDDGYITGFVAHDEFTPRQFWDCVSDMDAVAHQVWACVNEHHEDCDCYTLYV